MKYHNITKDDMVNGDGLRVVLWVAGCNHHCEGCHNPVTWNPEGGIPFDEKAKEELFKALKKSHTEGITFSGGDPLHPCNIKEITKLAEEIKEKYSDKTIWLYTGDVWENIYQHPLMKNIDVLVDGEFKINQKDVNLKWRGSTNQRVIDVKESLKKAEPVLLC